LEDLAKKGVAKVLLICCFCVAKALHKNGDQYFISI